ncbi:putative immune-type receptor 7 precursor, partial [Clarias magur]
NFSELKQLHTKTVTFGQDVIMQSDIREVKNKRNLGLYRQSFGKLPQFIARWYGQKDSTLLEGFNDKRFIVTAKDQKFDLSINNVKEDDGGEYFCTELEGTTVKFTSGTRLQFEGEEKKLCPTPGTLNKNTHSVTHQGSNSRDAE